MSKKGKKKKDDWFSDAADEVVADEKVQDRAWSAVRSQVLGEAASRAPGRVSDAAEAIREFGEAAYKITWAPDGSGESTSSLARSWAAGGVQVASNTGGPPCDPSPITPEEGLQAILKAVRTAGDSDAVFKAGGEWIAKITNGISEEISNAEQDRIDGF